MTLALNVHLGHLKSASHAVFSDDGRYRYQLTRCPKPRLPMLAVVGLAPSTAGVYRNDATVRHLLGLVEASGHGGFTLVNLYAGIGFDPKDPATIDDPVGALNDMYVQRAADEHDLIVLAWGEGADPVRARAVAARLWRTVCSTGGQLAVWQWTAGGQPHHLLEVNHNTLLQCLSGGAHTDFVDVDPRWPDLVASCVEPDYGVGGHYVSP